MIPSINDLVDPMILEIYLKNKSHEATPKDMYYLLRKYFGEELEKKDFEIFYKNRNSKWKNRLQETRRTLVNEKLLFNAKVAGQGNWKLTELGIKKGKLLKKHLKYSGPTNVKLKSIEFQIKKQKKENKSYNEGKISYREHKKRERNKKIVDLKKNNAFISNPDLPCEICRFSFFKKYGNSGLKFIEAHHIKPLSESDDKVKTKTEDLILICSNCHKMIHRKRPWLTVKEIKKLLEN